DPARCVFTDDSARNVEEAERFGIRAHLFRGPGPLREWLRDHGLLSTTAAL
ncbi:MAG: HAD family phosphatase, partial [Alphaproteobacteria bacterium]|nr:HAD family phosphatase [Alphaproteobacteria bacterium]